MYLYLINALTRYQIQWKYLDDGEVSADIPVVELTDSAQFSFMGKITDSEEEICRLICKEPTVKTLNGELPKGIFVRQFDDGETVVLNMFGDAGEYLILGKKVYLDTHGVYIYNGVPSVTDTKRKSVASSLKLEYPTHNIARAMYINDATAFCLETDEDRDLLFAVRRDVDAYVDGCKIDTELCSDVLPDGMRELYQISKSMVLKQGRHVIEAKNDFKYLPSVLLVGDFFGTAQSDKICSLKLSERKTLYTVGDSVFDYGKVVFKASVNIPAEATAIEIKGTTLYTRVLINGEPIGEAIAYPLVFSVDRKKHFGKVLLEIEQYSSQGPIFGDVDFFDKNSIASQWKSAPSPSKTRFGFDQINFVY